ncbi:MAG: methionyl-tRNA formyltransferase [Lachnospiraceae bacterium]|nr:methionyl-tRNA formyltransferase [Lachnospiraceae bacterium]
MRIVYMGTPEIAATILERLLAEPYEVVLVVTQPDRPKGRGKALACSPVKELAVSRGIPVFTPEKLRLPENVEVVREAAPDMIVVAAFGQILPKSVLDIPRYGCINVHASLLPKYRGAAPIQWSILDGEQETGITIMYMNEGLDTGDILTQTVVPIDADETGGSLHDKLAEAGAEALVQAIPGIIDGTIAAVPQGEMTTPYAKQLTKEMGRLEFSWDAAKLARYVRGLDPWPGTYTYRDGQMLKIFRATAAMPDECGSCPDTAPADCDVCADGAVPGTVVEVRKDAFRIQTGCGTLLVTEVQPQGKRRMSAEEYLRGYRLAEGTLLGSMPEEV